YCLNFWLDWFPYYKFLENLCLKIAQFKQNQYLCIVLSARKQDKKHCLGLENASFQTLFF
ncbi:MAG: hypothetical protein EAZ08_04310, partial [Cytophagales bacterium]